MGLTPPTTTRFSDKTLDPSPDKKRKKPNRKLQLSTDESPSTFSEIQNYDHLPRYLVASTISNDKSAETKALGSHNIFQIGKGLDHISKEYSEVTELKNGDLLIKANNLKAAEKFLNAKHIDIVPVRITLHNKLNCSYGKIFYEKIVSYSEEELVNQINMKYPGLIMELRKIKRNENGNLVDTGAAVITFNNIHRPSRIKIGYNICTVFEHIPNPLKCRNCQKLGHTKNHCKKIALCGECAQPPPHDVCNRKFCVNCNIESHTSNDPKCPTFLKHKSVNKIKINNRCTVREAWKIFNSNPSAHLITPHTPKATYAQVTSNYDSTKNQNTKSHSTEYTPPPNSLSSPPQHIIQQPTNSPQPTTSSSLINSSSSKIANNSTISIIEYDKFRCKDSTMEYSGILMP
ncbi:uncharacterized protein LOC142236743 [Haematobia irritans]|uniref:uncharacterized protein LOC142236743 n=1 Tax=Haematobia irritans TaxID=7368 RepID=UPI003F4F95D0